MFASKPFGERPASAPSRRGGSVSSKSEAPKQAMIRVARVSAAKEFEDFRSLPKYNHVPLAVINPSPTKKRARKQSETPDMEYWGTTCRLAERKNMRFEIPEHLTKPEVVITTPAVNRSTATNNGPMLNENGKPMTWKEKKNYQENLKRQQAEDRKVAKAQRAMKVFFGGIKSHLLDNKADGDPLSKDILSVTVGEAKKLIKERGFVRMVYQHSVKDYNKQMQLTKLEFSQFVKLFSAAETVDLFTFLTKRPARDSRMIDLSDSSINDRVDLSNMEPMFEKWFQEEDKMAAFLDPK